MAGGAGIVAASFVATWHETSAEAWRRIPGIFFDDQSLRKYLGTFSSMMHPMT
jgi:hypothetical protein